MIRYAIIENWDQLTEPQKQSYIDDSSEYISGIASPRLSLDGTKAMLKQAYGTFTLEEIKLELSGPEWVEEVNPF